jgi:WhiB family redox-sensing transcriptional regulator
MAIDRRRISASSGERSSTPNPTERTFAPLRSARRELNGPRRRRLRQPLRHCPTSHLAAQGSVPGQRHGVLFAVNDEAVGAAKAVCVACPVRRDCLAYAVGSPELVGVWAGTDERERRQMRRASA